MRTFLITLAAAASALAVATPASAQYFPVPQGNAYGYNNYGQARRLDARIDAIQRQITVLDRRNILSDREARRLRNDSRELERRLRIAARNGLHPGSATTSSAVSRVSSSGSSATLATATAGPTTAATASTIATATAVTTAGKTTAALATTKQLSD